MIEQWLIPAGLSGLVSFLVALGTTEYRLRRKQSVEDKAEINEWYSETASMASDVQNIWESDYERIVSDERKGRVDYDELQRVIKLRSKQINAHIAESSSLDVDEGVVEELEQLKDKSSALSQTITSIGNNTEFRDRGREMVEKAKNVENAALDQI